MFSVLQVLTVILVAVPMALALALDKETYCAKQSIYYPGFTIGGISEPVSLILTIILLFLTPLGSADFW